MFTERVHLLRQIRPPKNGIIDGPWLAKFLDVMTNTFGDCDARLVHRGGADFNRTDALTSPGPGGTRRPLEPYPITDIDENNPDNVIPQANVKFTGGDSFLDMTTLEVNNGLDIYADGANYLGDGIFSNVVVMGDFTVLGNCSGCTGGDPGEPSVGIEPVRFILTSGLEKNGYATANLLQVVAGTESVIATGVTVGGWSGQWYGNPGARGWCILKQDSKNDNGTAGLTYHVLWLDTWFMRFQLEADLSLNGTAQARQIAGETDTPVGDPFTVTDWLGKYRARNGAKGVLAVFQDQPGAYIIQDIQTDAERIVVTATGSGGGPTIDGTLSRWYRGRAPAAGGAAMSVDDPELRFGFVNPGAKLECEFNDTTGRYEIAMATVDTLVQTGTRYNATDHKYEITTKLVTVWAADDEGDWEDIEGTPEMEEVEVMVDWQIDGFDYEGKFRTIWVPEADDVGDWEVLATGEEC